MCLFLFLSVYCPTFVLVKLNLDTMQILLVVTLPYFLLAVLLAVVVGMRLLYLRKQRDMSEEKIRFFLNTAHAIRTPLMLIKAPLEELQQDATLTPQGKANVVASLRNVNTLMRLTVNLINYERTSLRFAVLNRAAHELNGFMMEMLSVFRAFADTSHIKLTYESNFDRLLLYFDSEKMELLLKNLLSNALKYTPAEGSVQVIAADEGDYWSITVRDSGIGIPLSLQKRLFRHHFRGKNSVNANTTGAGIGLMVVAHQVELHKGKLTFSSKEGEGTTVTVRFPKIIPPEGEVDKGRLEELEWKFLATADRYIEKNMATPGFNVDMLCSLLGMSRTSFYNKLKALTDESPADYIRSTRMKCAARLLEKQEYSVTEVAELTGFNDAKYFREVFKRYFGVSPTQYMKLKK